MTIESLQELEKIVDQMIKLEEDMISPKEKLEAIKIKMQILSEIRTLKKEIARKQSFAKNKTNL